MTDQPRDRGICGASSMPLIGAIHATCTLLAAHPGWHRADDGMSWSRICAAEYQRPGGRQPGDRIVRCDLLTGHDGDHEEVDTGSTWPRTTEQPGDRGHDRRETQIQAAIDVLRRDVSFLEAEPGCEPEDVAPRLVDAVNAAGGDEIARLRAELEEMTRLHDAKHRDWQQADNARQALLVERANLRADAQLRDQGEVRGYQQAVEALRDEAAFLNWWTPTDGTGRTVNGMAADYLEAVGPGRDGSEVHVTINERPTGRTLPREALRDVITVVGYVSRGRRYVDVEPYPDALARRVLGALDDAGLLDAEEVQGG